MTATITHEVAGYRDVHVADGPRGQSLATGATGIALLAVERAMGGDVSWAQASSIIRRAAAGPIDVGPHTALYYGAPALAFLLHTCTADGQARYHDTARALDTHVEAVTRRRLAEAAARLGRHQSTRFAEYDLFYGLTGLGALLLTRAPQAALLQEILQYLIALTRPMVSCGVELPGWWVEHDPDPLLPTPGGHANLGMAHGAAGILALLALARRDSRTTPGLDKAIGFLLGWFDRWRQDSDDGPWWPQWITRDDLRVGRPHQQHPGRPSWCYGAVGIARAQQLAAIALGDHTRRAAAEQALAATLTSTHLDRLTDSGLCHGIAGVYQTAYRAAADATDPTLARLLPSLATQLLNCTRDPTNHGLLTGTAGIDLAAESIHHPPRSGWDRCLLIV